MRPSKQLDSGDHIGQSLPTSGFGGSEDVSPVEYVRDRPSLDLSRFREAKPSDRLLSLLGKGQLLKLKARKVLIFLIYTRAHS